MKIEKHMKIMGEVEETVKGALHARDILSYQRRLASMLSLGVQQLVEIHLHRLRVIKPGTQIKHEWFGMGNRNLSLKLSAILTTEINSIPRLNDILELAKTVEADRNEIIYGSPLFDGKILREKIDAFLEIKKIMEEEHGQES